MSFIDESELLLLVIMVDSLSLLSSLFVSLFTVALSLMSFYSYYAIFMKFLIIQWVRIMTLCFDNGTISSKLILYMHATCMYLGDVDQ